MTQGTHPGVSRRTLVAALAAVVLPTAGCGIRLEDDAPRIPLVPTRTPVPDEGDLVALTRDTAALAALADTVAGGLARDLAMLHRRQHTVLRTTLLAEGVPATDLGATPSSGPVATAGGGRPALAAAEAASAADAPRFAGVQDDLRATMASLHAQRYAAATLLAGRPPTVALDPVAGDRVGALASTTSAAVYFLEIVAARSARAQRASADATLTALRALRADQLAGGASSSDSLGHPLPFPVDDAAAARRLAREALSSLRAGYGEHLAPIVTSDGRAGMSALTRWLGTVEVEAHRWGVALAPFPGLG